MDQVLLVNCPISFEKKEVIGDEFTDPPLGPLYIASYLRENGISVGFCDISAKQMDIKEVMEEIKKQNPLVIGLSALSSSIRSAVQLASALKKEWGQSCPVIGIGGPHISADPDLINRFPVFDFAIVGEGEIMMLKLVQKIIKGEKVQGIYNSQPIINLDALPFPARDLVDIKDYHRATEGEKDETKAKDYLRASLVGSRGCPFKCCFCSRPVHKTNTRFRSAENIVEEVESLYEDYNGNYHFHDDTFTLNQKNVANFCKLIIKRGLKIKWGAMTRANSINEPLLKLMADSGCFNLFFGVESGNERIRNEVICKNVKDKDILNAIRLCRKYGIQSNIFLMLGFPGETLSDIEDTVNFGRRCQADVMGIHITVVLPGSDLYQMGLHNGYIDKDFIDRYIQGNLGEGFKGGWPLYIPQGLTLEDLQDAKKRAYRRFYLNPLWIARRILWDLRKPNFFFEDLKLVKAFLQAIFYGGTKSAMS